MTSFFQGIVALAARIALSQIFVLSGVNHLLTWGGTIKLMTGKGMAMQSVLGGSGKVLVHLMLTGAVAFLLIGGLSVLLGTRARLGAVLLIVFLIPTTLIFHDFWNCNGQERMLQTINFMKNTGLGGGLLMVLAFGSGTLSLNGFRWRRSKNTPADVKPPIAT
jgi:putative oxidoreductase